MWEITPFPVWRPPHSLWGLFSSHTPRKEDVEAVITWEIPFPFPVLRERELWGSPYSWGSFAGSAGWADAGGLPKSVPLPTDYGGTHSLFWGGASATFQALEGWHCGSSSIKEGSLGDSLSPAALSAFGNCSSPHPSPHQELFLLSHLQRETQKETVIWQLLQLEQWPRPALPLLYRCSVPSPFPLSMCSYSQPLCNLGSASSSLSCSFWFLFQRQLTQEASLSGLYLGYGQSQMLLQRLLMCSLGGCEGLQQ